MSTVVQQIQHMLYKEVMLMHVFQKRRCLLVCSCPEVFPIFKAERLPKTQCLEEKWCTAWLLAPAEMIRNVFMVSSTLNWLPLCSKDLGAKREELVTDDFGRACHLLNHLHHLLLRLEFLSVVNEGILPAWGDHLTWTGWICKNQVVRMEVYINSLG